MGAHIVNLLNGAVFDPSGVLSPAWRSMRVLKVAAGESATLEAFDDEYACFVIAGDGNVTVDGRESALAMGTALVLVHGATADLHAGREELAIFVTAIAVPPPSNGQGTANAT